MVPFDYVIVLNKEVWEDPEFSREKKLALLDHEMCHTAPALDADGDKVRDTKGRLCWRVRGHDIEEFRGIVERHGTYKRDLEMFAQALLRRKKEPLLAPQIELPHTSLADDLAALTPAYMAAQKLKETCERDGATLTISTPGMEPVVINGGKRKKMPKDPG